MTDGNRPSLSLPVGTAARPLSTPTRDATGSMQQATRTRQNASAFNANLTKTLGSALNSIGQKSSASDNKKQTTNSRTQAEDRSGATATTQKGLNSSKAQRDEAVMQFVHARDGEYLVNEGEFIRRGNTFIITTGELKDYRVVYKGGRNFQIRNPDGESLMIYHGPRRRPRIAAPA